MNARGSMNAEADHELTQDQWETLKALRLPARERRRLSGLMVDQLVAAGLVEMIEGTPALTQAGRKVLIRGSSRLLDVAA